MLQMTCRLLCATLLLFSTAYANEREELQEEIPEGMLNASKITLGELSRIFHADLKEADLVKKFGKPATRLELKTGGAWVGYLFYNAGRESGKYGHFMTGFRAFFSAKGKFVVWDIGYETLEPLESLEKSSKREPK